MFIRNNGLVKLGGCSWLSSMTDACNYGFQTRARKDRNAITHIVNRFGWLLSSRSLFQLLLDSRSGYLCIRNDNHSLSFTEGTVSI